MPAKPFCRTMSQLICRNTVNGKPINHISGVISKPRECHTVNCKLRARWEESSFFPSVMKHDFPSPYVLPNSTVRTS